MGTIRKGLLGGVSGKVGNVVGGNWKGIDYLRIMPASVANPKSEKQMNQRIKFMTVIRFLQPFTEFVRIGFKAYATKMTAFNAAMSYNFKNAISGTYPDYSIDYSKVLLSRGSLTSVYNAACVAELGDTVKLSWDNNSGSGTAQANDKVLAVIFNPATHEVIYTMDAGQRGDAQAELDVPTSYSGKEVHCFMAFASLDSLIANGGKKAISDSCYAGSVSVL